MTLLELETDVFSRTSKNLTPDPVTKARIDRFLNQRMRRILAEPGIHGLREAVFTFASVVGQQAYALPQGVAKVHRIWEPITRRRLQLVSLETIRDIVATASAIPMGWAPYGYTEVAVQPSNASQIWAVSTAAGDTQTIYLDVVLSTGERRTISQALTGVTALQVGALATVVVIERVYVATVAIGTITILEDSAAGAELARITLGRTAPQYQTILLDVPASAVVTYSADASWFIADMAQAGDVPPIPEDFHYMLSAGARMDEYEKTDDDRYQRAKADWDGGMVRLKWWLANQTSNSQGYQEPSNLGSMYPSGRW